LDVPLPVAKTVETQFVGHLSSTHSIGKILLVGKNEQDGVSEFILIQHSVELISSSIDTITIVRVNHEDKALSVLIVVSPEGADLILSSDIPHSEANILVLNSLDVEP
jgi:hypothetical protein